MYYSITIQKEQSLGGNCSGSVVVYLPAVLQTTSDMQRQMQPHQRDVVGHVFLLLCKTIISTTAQSLEI